MLGWTYSYVYCLSQRAVFPTNKCLNIYESGVIQDDLSQYNTKSLLSLQHYIGAYETTTYMVLSMKCIQ